MSDVHKIEKRKVYVLQFAMAENNRQITKERQWKELNIKH